ncbi:MAG: hypothetical protein IJF65_08550 [Clostridia bacterium]|nr:hypothetical protein [Clostridia bacterium]
MQKNLNNEHLVRDPLREKAEVRKEPKRTTKQLLIGVALLIVLAGAAIIFSMPQQGDAFSAVEAYLKTEPVLMEKYGENFAWRLTSSEIVTRMGHEGQDVRTGVYLVQIGGDTWEIAAHQVHDAWAACPQCLKQLGVEE